MLGENWPCPPKSGVAMGHWPHWTVWKLMQASEHSQLVLLTDKTQG